jgi:hypothetical protein
MKKFTKSVIFMFWALLASFTARAQSGQQYSICVSTNLSPTLPEGVPSGAVSDVSFAARRLRDSTGGLRLHNLFERKVTGVELLVDYLDQKGLPLVRMPYVALTSRAQKTFTGMLHTEAVESLHKSIRPEESLRIVGESFGVVSICPTNAKVTFLHIVFADGQTAEWKTAEWSTEPFIEDIPATVNFSCNLRNSGNDIYLRVGVNAEGRISTVTPLAPREWGCLDEFKKALTDWAYYPALQSGRPSPSEVNILLRVNLECWKQIKDFGLISSQEISRPTVAVDFVPVKSQPTKWTVTYGPKPFGFIAPDCELPPGSPH